MVNARTALSARQSSVAVACVLEGLNDAYAVARIQHDRRVSLIMAAESAPDSATAWRWSPPSHPRGGRAAASVENGIACAPRQHAGGPKNVNAAPRTRPNETV